MKDLRYFVYFYLGAHEFKPKMIWVFWSLHRIISNTWYFINSIYFITHSLPSTLVRVPHACKTCFL